MGVGNGKVKKNVMCCGEKETNHLCQHYKIVCTQCLTFSEREHNASAFHQPPFALRKVHNLQLWHSPTCYKCPTHTLLTIMVVGDDMGLYNHQLIMYLVGIYLACCFICQHYEYYYIVWCTFHAHIL